MRESLTIAASVLIVALCAALFGPMFVDWTAQRNFVEVQLSQAMGTPISTQGRIDVSLLPTPRLQVDALEFGQNGAIALRSRAVRLELAVMPLLRGELRFMEASFQEPQVEITLDRLRAAGGDAPDIQIEKLSLEKARFVLRESGREIAVLNEVDLSGEASSLAGPFKGQGQFKRAGVAVGWRFSTGAIEADRLRLKLTSDEAAGLPRLDLDGALVLGIKPRFEGQAIASAAQPFAWRLAGPVVMDAQQLRADTVELRVGGDEGALTLAGALGVSFAKPSVEMQWQSRQLDLDRAFDKVAGLRAAVEGFGASTFSDTDIALKLTTSAILVGGDGVTDVSLDLSRKGTAPVHLDLAATFPGRARLQLNGAIETGFAARYEGKVQASLREPIRLADWMAPWFPDQAQMLRRLPVRNLEIAGDVDLSGAGVSARGLRLRLDRSNLSGALAYTRAIGGERARFFADLTSDALDLDGLPDLSGPSAALRGADMSLSLAARGVRLARFGEGVVDAGRISLKLVQNRETLRLETLSIAGLGGADVNASGMLQGQSGAFDIGIDAQRLTELAALWQRIAPGPLPMALSQRAVALSPAKLNLHIEGEALTDGFRLSVLEIESTARGTRVQANLRPQTGGLASGVMRIETRDAAMLLRQFGFEVLPLPLNGGGRVQVSLRAIAKGGFELAASGQIGGVDLTFDGRAGEAVAAVEGAVTLHARDGAQMLRVLGFGLPDVTKSAPLEGNGQLLWSRDGFALSGLSAVVMGVQASGDLRQAQREGRSILTGRLQLDQASLAQVSTLLLGPVLSVRAGQLWSDQRFGPGMADLPRLDLDLHSKAFTLPNDYVLRDAKLRLQTAPSVMSFDAVEGAHESGRLSGRLTLRRDGANSFLTGALKVDGLSVPPSLAQAQMSLESEFTSSGDTPAALVSGLAGTARVQLGALTFARADPGALARVFVAAEEDRLSLSPKDYESALRRDLEQGPFTLPPRDALVTLAGGVARMVSPNFSASIDLRNLSAEARLSLSLPVERQIFPGIALVWRGPWQAMQREVEAGALLNLMSARALAREQARSQALEDDIAERAGFARRQRGLDFLRRRQREVDEFMSQQPR